MSLSERDRRELAQIERHLAMTDPRLDRSLRRSAGRRRRQQRARCLAVAILASSTAALCLLLGLLGSAAAAGLLAAGAYQLAFRINRPEAASPGSWRSRPR